MNFNDFSIYKSFFSHFVLTGSNKKCVQFYNCFVGWFGLVYVDTDIAKEKFVHLIQLVVFIS